MGAYKMIYNQTNFISSERRPNLKVVKMPRTSLDDPTEAGLPSVMERLQELTLLEKGWDGYHGVPVSLENAIFAFKMLESICSSETPMPQIVPGSGGDLQIEWHTLIGDLELHVRAPNNVHAWCYIVGCEPDGEEVELTNNFLSVVPWVKEITESPIAPATAAA